jgi:hypothetical protein
VYTAAAHCQFNVILAVSEEKLLVHVTFLIPPGSPPAGIGKANACNKVLPLGWGFIWFSSQTGCALLAVSKVVLAAVVVGEKVTTLSGTLRL